MRLFLAASALAFIGSSQALAVTSCYQTHQVTIGETCKSIASRYSLSESDIQQWNKELNTKFDCDSLKTGDVICIKLASISKRSDKHDEFKHQYTTTKHHKKPLHNATKHHKRPLHTTTVKKPVPAFTHAAKADKNNNAQSSQQAGQSNINKRSEKQKSDSGHKDDNKDEKKKITAHHKKTTTKKHTPKKHNTTKKHVPKKHTTTKKDTVGKNNVAKTQDDKKN